MPTTVERVAEVWARQADASWSSGSGYLIAPRLLITSTHVLSATGRPEPGAEIKVRTASRTRLWSAACTWSSADPTVDVAVLEITDDDWADPRRSRPLGTPGQPPSRGGLPGLRLPRGAGPAGRRARARSGWRPSEPGGGRQTAPLSPPGAQPAEAQRCRVALGGDVRRRAVRRRLAARRGGRRPSRVRRGQAARHAGRGPVRRARFPRRDHSAGGPRTSRSGQVVLPSGRPAPPPLPAALLRADAEAVRWFTPRDNELARLVGWCSTDEIFDARLVFGAGGLGKTRLARQLVAHLRREGWVTGQVVAENAAALPEEP